MYNKLLRLMKYRFVTILICVLIAHIQSRGQYYLSSKQYGFSSGLGHRHVNASFIDSKGKKVILTANSMAFFEGNSFKSISYPEAFSSKGFNTICEDNMGNYWVSEAFEWFYSFNIRQTYVYNHEQFIPSKNKLPNSIQIESIISDENRLLLIGTKTGEIYSYSANNNKLSLRKKIGKLPVKLLYAKQNKIVFCEAKGTLEDDNIQLINYAGKILFQEKLLNKFGVSVLSVADELYAVFDGRTQTEVVKLGTNITFSLPKNHSYTYLTGLVYEPKFKSLIFYSNDKISFLSPNLETLYTHDFPFSIHHIIPDGHGNLFMSTDNGLVIVRIQKGVINTLLYNPNPEDNQNNYSCRQIYKLDKNTLIVNTNQCRQVVNLQTGKSEKLPTLNTNLQNDFILSILHDKQGNLWFGEQQLVTTDLVSKVNHAYFANYETRIWSMTEHKQGLMLGFEKKGIGYFDKSKGSIEYFDGKQPQELASATVYDFLKLKDKVFIASSSGLYVLDNDGVIKNIPYSFGQKKATYDINLFDKKQANTLILSTEEGILLLDIATSKIRQFIQDKHFAKVKFLSCYETQNGYWASSEQGIWHFDKVGNLLKIYTELDGLTNNECNTLAHFQDEEGTLYFGGLNGINVIKPEAFANQPKEGVMLIRNIRIFDNQELVSTIPALNGNIITLKTSENSIELEAEFDDYMYDCEKQFYYTVGQEEKNWAPFVAKNFRMDNLPYGESLIHLKVVACNNFANSNILTVKVFRAYPLYYRWYFWVMVAVVMGLLIWAGFQLYAYNYRMRNLKLKALVDRQTVSLHENLKFRDELLKLLVHDVRHPIISFNNLTDKLNLLIQKQEYERLSLLGTESKSRSENLLWLIDNLILWIQSTNKNETVVYQNHDLIGLIHKIIRSYQNDISVRNLTFVVEPEAFIAKIDEKLFVITMRNIIFNAIEYAKRDTTVQIKISRNAQLVEVTCYNLVEPDTQPRAESRGLKIGLSVLKTILEKQSIELFNDKVDDIYLTRLIIPEK